MFTSTRTTKLVGQYVVSITNEKERYSPRTKYSNKQESHNRHIQNLGCHTQSEKERQWYYMTEQMPYRTVIARAILLNRKWWRQQTVGPSMDYLSGSQLET